MNKTIRLYGLASLLYGICTVLFFYPCLPSLGHALIGPPEDNMQFYWFLWNGSRALLDPGLPLMHTTLIYYPEGTTLYYANYYYFGFLVAALFQWLLPLITLFNLLILLSFVLSGVGAFMLIRYLLGDWRAALLGGYVFAFNPSHFAHALHHITIASIQFIPFFVLFFLKSVREGKRRHFLLAILFLVLNALCDWNYLVFGAIFMVLAYVYLAFRRGKLILPGLLGCMAVIGAGTFLVLSPLLVPMLRIGWESEVLQKLTGSDIYVADLAGFFVPHSNHLLGGLSAVEALNLRQTGNAWEKIVYLGAVNLLVVAFATKAIFKKNAKYYAGLLVFMMFAMGSTPHVLAQDLPLLFPYRIVELLPFISNARIPSRFVAYAYLFLGILVALAFHKLFLSKTLRFRGKFLMAAAVLLIFLDFYSVARAVTPVRLPPWYRLISEDKEKDFAVLDIPWDGGRYMLYQTLHGIPNLQGYLGRRFDTALAERLPYEVSRLPLQKKVLEANRVKYLVIYKDKIYWKNPEDPRQEAYRRTLSAAVRAYERVYEKLFENEEAALFRVYS